MRLTMWIDRHRVKQFQETVSETGMRFRGNPLDMGTRFYCCIEGENYEEFRRRWSLLTTGISEKDRRPGFFGKFLRRVRAFI